MDHLVVVTGGPGPGETTLIDHLAGLGYGRTVEAGRAVIRDRRQIDGPALAGGLHRGQRAPPVIGGGRTHL
ncbi:hypothetical protein GCM10009642_08600 [Nocardiopsis metallicus]|uniref:Putative ATPase n=1 Tax=Nocardiopsis metallicus TaxID=179819 RepID=A0A840WRA6_9ACTN|nr:putative ATPase [Nocardiopsis metallicus]